MRGVLTRPAHKPEDFTQPEAKSTDAGGGSLNANMVFLKGQIELPVQGKILESYGKHFDAQLSLLRFQKGLTIGLEEKQEVKACLEGEVAFSGDLKGYGKVVILQHKNQIFTVYGHLGEIQVERGAAVAKGQSIGSSGAEANVYFELRDRNLAVNPLDFVAKDAGWKI